LPAKDWINPPTHGGPNGTVFSFGGLDDKERTATSIQDRPFMALAVRALDAPVPGEIYCLADLPFGELAPTIELRRQMSSALYGHASSQRLKGNFTERAGTQYRIATDTLQYYIVLRYGDEVKM
jgi:hypothetical protein